MHARIAHLTGLKSPRLDRTNVTDRGLRYIGSLPSLECLHLPQRVTDRGLTYLGTLPNLKHLAISRIYFIDPNMNREYYTDKGLRHLAELKELSFLNIYTDDTFSTAALQQLRSELPNLSYLRINGTDALSPRPTRRRTPLR